MDPVMQQAVITSQEEKPVVPTVTEPKQNNFLVILLSILLIISCLIAGFFAYQTQNLVKELNSLKADTQKLELSPTPVSTPDPTADWKIYTNTSSSYQIKYPSDWKVVNQSAGSMGAVVADSRYVEIGLGEGKSGTVGIEELQMIPPSEESNLNNTKVVGNLTLRCNGKFTTDTKTWCWIKVPNQEKYLNIQVFKNADDAMNTKLDQILSTFKFTNDIFQTEEKDVQEFVKLFSTTYVASDWSKLKTLLTIDAAKQMSEGMTMLRSEVFFDSFNILTVKKDNSMGGYVAEVEFIKDGKPYKNPVGNPKIIITKENNEWKSLSWYLYQ